MTDRDHAEPEPEAPRRGTGSRLRPWLLAILAVAVVVVGVQQYGLRRGHAVFPDLAHTGDVARIELARGRDQVVLGRRADTGQWVVMSAADAPGDTARIETTIGALQQLRGDPAAPDDAETTTEPLEIRLSDADGAVLGHARLRPGSAVRVADGVALAMAKLPPLPLWQSAWADLAPPRIAAGDIRTVHRIGPDGRLALDAQATARVAEILDRLSAQGFVAAASVPWAGASMLQLMLADGAIVDLQQVPAGEGMFLIRMTSDTRADIRVAREWAFRTTRPLP